jgi:hypothetical protein
MPADIKQSFSTEQVRKALNSMNRGTAPGRSGITIDHLQQMAKASDEFAHALTGLINGLVFNAKQTMAPSLAMTRLVGIWKTAEEAALRVIAIQEPILRLASRMIQQATKDLTLAALSKYQMGYAVPDATVAIGLAIRECCSQTRVSHEPIFVIKMDIAGAFDSVPFQAILAAIAMAAWPAPIQEFVRMRQERETMIFGSEQLIRMLGMPQGSSDSPAIFPLVLDPILRLVAEGVPSCKVGNLILPPIMAYQDDVYLCASDRETAQQMIDHYIRLVAHLGMRIRPEKGWSYGNRPDSPFLVDGNATPTISWTDSSIDILGVPFGSTEQQTEAQDRAVSLMENDMRRLHAIPNTLVPEEVKCYLAIQCVPPQLAHLLRHSPAPRNEPAIRADRTIQFMFCTILGLTPTPNLLGAITTPQRRGGWGLMALAITAKVAPRATLLSMTLTIDSEYPVQQALTGLLQSDNSESLFVNRACEPTVHLPIEFNNPICLASAIQSIRKLQSFAYGEALEETTSRFLAQLPETAYMRRYPTRDHTFSTPPKPYFPLGSAISTRLQYMVGASHAGLLRRAVGNRCPIDNAIMTSPHALVCKGTSPITKTNMHDCIRAELVRSIRSVPGATVLEEHQMPILGKSRLDLVVDIAGKRFGIDFSACEVATDLMRRPESILRDREMAKNRKYAQYAALFNRPGEPEMKIVPLVFTSHGSPSDSAMRFLKLVKSLSNDEFSPKSTLAKIAAISAHYNHRAILSWRIAVTRRLDPQSYERPSGAKWQTAFRRWK